MSIGVAEEVHQVRCETETPSVFMPTCLPISLSYQIFLFHVSLDPSTHKYHIYFLDAMPNCLPISLSNQIFLVILYDRQRMRRSMYDNDGQGNDDYSKDDGDDDDDDEDDNDPEKNHIPGTRGEAARA